MSRNAGMITESLLNAKRSQPRFTRQLLQGVRHSNVGAVEWNETAIFWSIQFLCNLLINSAGVTSSDLKKRRSLRQRATIKPLMRPTPSADHPTTDTSPLSSGFMSVGNHYNRGFGTLVKRPGHCLAMTWQQVFREHYLSNFRRI